MRSHRYLLVIGLSAFVGCASSNSGPTPQNVGPAAQANGTPLVESPNLTCKGTNKAGIPIQFVAELKSLRPSEEQPENVLLGSGSWLLSENNQVLKSGTDSSTTVGYVLRLGGDIQRIDFELGNALLSLEMDNEGSLNSSQFDLVEYVNGTAQEFGNLSCTFDFRPPQSR